jgi:hypothetical protein
LGAIKATRSAGGFFTLIDKEANDNIMHFIQLRRFPEKRILALIPTPAKRENFSHGKTQKNTENSFFFTVLSLFQKSLSYSIFCLARIWVKAKFMPIKFNCLQKIQRQERNESMGHSSTK